MTMELFQRFEEANVHLEKCILLAGAIASDTISDELEEFLEDLDDDDLQACLGKLPEWVWASDGTAIDGDGFAEWLLETRKLGFLVQFRTPVMTWRGGEATFSWGFTTGAWFYGDTLDAAIEAGFAWVQNVRQQEKARAPAPPSRKRAAKRAKGDPS